MKTDVLRCVFGTRWDDHKGCLFCAAESDRHQEGFLEDVRRGVYDREGYTPAERRRPRVRAT